MAYSVIVWLVDPGKHPQQDEEEEWAQATGAATGSNLGYTLPRMRYGVYENQDAAEQALGYLREPAAEPPSAHYIPGQQAVAHPRR